MSWKMNSGLASELGIVKKILIRIKIEPLHKKRYNVQEGMI